jgi:hypothetical protein
MEHLEEIKLKEKVIDNGVIVCVLNAKVISVYFVMQNEQGRDFGFPTH